VFWELTTFPVFINPETIGPWLLRPLPGNHPTQYFVANTGNSVLQTGRFSNRSFGNQVVPSFY
jgi:hypothetical protein